MYLVSGHYNLGNALLQLSQAYYRGTSAGPLMSPTKKAEQAVMNQDYGWRRAMAEAIAEMLTVKRVEKFALLDKHEKILGHEVAEVFRKAQADLDWTGNVPDGDIASQIVDRLLALVDGRDGEYAENYESLRRNKILAGLLQPGPEDREWIEAIAEEKRQEASKVLSLLGTVDRAEKGNEQS